MPGLLLAQTNKPTNRFQNVYFQSSNSPVTSYTAGSICASALVDNQLLERQIYSQTTKLSLTGALNQHAAGIDFQALLTKENYFYSRQVHATYAYSWNIGKNKLTEPIHLLTGLGFTIQNNQYDWSKLSFGDQIDSNLGFVYSSKELPTSKSITIPLLDAGVMVYAPDRWFFHWQTSNINQPVFSFSLQETNSSERRIRIYHTLDGGYTLFRKRAVNLLLTANYSSRINPHNPRFGALLGYKHWVIGYASNDWHAQLQFGYFSPTLRCSINLNSIGAHDQFLGNPMILQCYLAYALNRK